MTGGRGYDGLSTPHAGTPDAESLVTFEDLVEAIGANLRHQVETSYAQSMGVLHAQMRWGTTPLTSCFFDGCIDRARDLAETTKYNILSCGGAFFASMVDSLAAVCHVVYDSRAATLEEVAVACRDNFAGHDRLRHQLLGAPKQGNDDPSIDELIRTVERLRDEPVKELCRDPRDGTPFGNSHVTRSSAVTVGRHTGATPDGRLAGQPLAPSVAAACGTERSGPTALLNSILKLDPVESWQCGYNVNMRLQNSMLADEDSRRKVGWLLTSYFQRGGQEMQINSVDSATLRAAQKRPEEYRDLVVRIAGYSDYFVNLRVDVQEEIIARTEHVV
jgi:formate C-acetyltransferase